MPISVVKFVTLRLEYLVVANDHSLAIRHTLLYHSKVGWIIVSFGC